MIKAVIFDLDGTLVDTLEDIARMVNGLLADQGLPPHTVDEYRYLVGRGFKKLLESAIPPGQDIDAAELEARGFARYKAMGSANSRPYPGTVETLRKLASMGIKLGVLSNKPDPMTQDMIKELFPDIAFGFVRGGIAGRPLKPDPESALEGAAALGVKPEECAYLGDSDVDMETANRAGMLPVGAVWGFRTAEELKKSGAGILLESITDIMELPFYLHS